VSTALQPASPIQLGIWVEPGILEMGTLGIFQALAKDFFMQEKIIGST
jgi:hypothetical protein